MKATNTLSSAECGHKDHAKTHGLVIVSLCGILNDDQGLPSCLCRSLPETSLENVCHFDLSPHHGCLAACLSTHRAAIIVDSTQTGAPKGTVSIMDLSALMDKTTPIKINTSHGLSLAKELRLAKRSGKLPTRLIFFGVEVGGSNGQDEMFDLALDERLPLTISNLCLLVGKVLETLKRYA